MKKSCVLVSGGAGYIGSHTSVELINAGYDVVIVDNLSNSDLNAVEGVRKITGVDIPFVEVDCCDRAAFRKVFEQYEFDSVIHFAASKAVGESVQKPLEYYGNNLTSFMNVIGLMREFGRRNIVFSSSCTVYGEPEKQPIEEGDRTEPTNPYGATKLAIENMLKWCDCAYNIRYVALRYFNAAGSDTEAGIGEDHNPESHLIPLVMKTALGQRDHIGIFGEDYPTPDGTCVRDYIHVKDLAEAHLLALEYLERGGSSDVFNLGNGAGYSVREIIETARRITGKEIKAVVEPRRGGDPSVLIASNKKAAEVLGWKPVLGLDQIVSDAWAWHSGHPNGYEG